MNKSAIHHMSFFEGVTQRTFEERQKGETANTTDFQASTNSRFQIYTYKRYCFANTRNEQNMEISAFTLEEFVVVDDGDRFYSCQVIYSKFGLAIHQNDHQARRRFVEWAQNEIAVVPNFHKRILFSDEAHFWLNGYVNKQNCRIWSEANPQVYVETPLHPEKLNVWCALWAGGILLQKR
ncbi:hypothetical protein TNCV_2252881 [Trichonephila clavipes]|nr:hypothetical protein TNCV_2252881 [Trichonephila clavipes]